MNWRGRPLVSYDAVVELIGATTTRSGLKVRAERDIGLYPTKTRVSDEDLAPPPPTSPTTMPPAPEVVGHLGLWQ